MEFTKASIENKSYNALGLFDTVVQGGYCIGCGACAAVQNSPVVMQLDDYGQFQATLKPGARMERLDVDLRLVCPFSDKSPNETQLGKASFGDIAMYDEHLGYYLGTYAGHVAEGYWRAQGSSGGMGKWILCEMLKDDLVDAVIEVNAHIPDEDSPMLYQYRVLHTVQDARAGSKSVYYPVEMSEVLDYVRAHPGRYAITGIPCFIKAIRLFARQEPLVDERIRYCVGLICGHLKSTKYAEMIAWQLGVEPGELSYIDFRKKLPGANAKEKGVEVRSQDNNTTVNPPDVVQNLFGTDYNHGFFQYNACDFCDDVVAETADLTIGDAWLPEYIQDGDGTNVVVTRHPDLEQLIRRAIETGRLALEAVSVDKVVQSQAGGFRQRREGLRYRLYLADQAGRWRPEKRVKPGAMHIGPRRKAIYRHRMLLSQRSHKAFRKALELGDFSVFRREMQGLLDQYRTLNRPTFVHRIKRGVQRRIERVKRKLKN